MSSQSELRNRKVHQFGLANVALAKAVPARGRRLVLAIAALLVAGALGWFFGGGRSPAPAPAPAPALPVQAATPSVSAAPESAPLPPAGVAHDRAIAVLPLVNASRDPEQQFFSDGLSENLIDALSRFDGLKVIGRISAFQFRDSTDDSATIGRKLGVAYLLTGSVQRAGGDVRIRVSLTKADDGSTLWAEHYDRPYENLFSLQDDIARAVADALRVRLLAPGEGTGGDRPPGGDVAAYDAYLHGLKYWYDQEFPVAAEHMAEAVRLDPAYALAWARYSESLSTAATFWPRSDAVAAAQLRESQIAADTALRLAPGLGPAHTARASLRFYAFDAAGALAACEQAVALAPADGMVLNSCGYTLGGIGRLDEAIRLRERLLVIEPLYDVNHFQYAELLMATGRLGEAEKYLHIAENVSEPDPYRRVLLALMRGDAEAAMASAKAASADNRPLLVALAAQLAGGRAADEALATAVADDTVAASRELRIAQMHALRGDASGAVAWLERTPAAERRFVLADPLLLRLRDHSWFIAFCREAALAPPGECEAPGVDQLRRVPVRGD